MQRRAFIQKSCTAGLATFISPFGWVQAFGEQSVADLEKRFQQPLLVDHPQAIWCWMNGHISKEGITHDLQAMKAAGIGGVFNFDVGVNIPKGPVDYFSNEWLQLKKHAIQEASRLGLRFTLHNCPGWSASGGPWITPEMAMKQLAWSELYIAGGKPVELQLPVPFHKLGFYRDVAVLAFPSLEGERELLNYTVSGSNGPVAKEAVTGENSGGVIVRPATENDIAWLLFRFKEPFEVRFITFLISAVDKVEKAEEGRTSVVLEASADGTEFSTIATISTGLEAELQAGDKFITYDIPPVKARYFRLRSSQPRRYSQVRFSGIHRMKNFLEKTGSRYMFSGEETSPLFISSVQEVPAGSVIDSRSVVELTNLVDENGRLQWAAPEGAWTIIRFGYTAVPSFNKAAPEGGTGLECDKLSKEAFDVHFNTMLNRLKPALDAMGKSGKLGMEIDSYEAGPQTWTAAFPEEFQQRRGYAILRYLPALTGRILDSSDKTEHFLWDFRRTQADLIAENYYGRFTTLCHQHQITTYIEPYENGPFAEMQIGAKADVAMGEWWHGLHFVLQGNLSVRRTGKMAASIMSTNGRAVVGAEAFTSEPESSRWQEYPFALKATGDKMFCQGINQLIIHRAAHQPNPFARPGMTMGPWGIHFDTTNTWFAQGKDWLRYTARCQMLLQQGLPVRDLLYFTGEEANVHTKVNRDELYPSPPEGYEYDLIHAETILNNVHIQNGEIVLLHGMKYRLLVLQDFKGLTLPLLQKLQQLVTAGMILIGKKPEYALGLQQYNSTQFKTVVDRLWGPDMGGDAFQKNVGQGQVHWGTPVATILDKLQIKPAFGFTSRSGDAPVLFTHRRTGETEIFFICNQRRTFEDLVCVFRVKNKQPEIWDPATGKTASMPLFEAVEEGTRVPLRLDPYGSLFIIFRAPAIKPRLLSLKKEDEIVLAAKPFPLHPRTLFQNVHNNFTIALWAKPEMNILTRSSVHMGNVKHLYTEFYAIYPSGGRQLYGEKHATCGLAIGRNGVAVWENEAYPVMVLVAETPLQGWSHVTLIYEGGIPSVFVNGKKIASGKKSGAVVHPGLGEAYLQEGASFYNGDMTAPRLFNEVLTLDQIRLLADEEPSYETPLPPVEIISYKQKPTFLFWQNGRYSVEEQSGKSKHFSITGIQHPLVLNNGWEVQFPPHSGAPSSITLQELISLHRHPEAGVRYFSGTATYKKKVFLQQGTFTQGRRLFLHLGRVEVVAQVIINGRNLGILWKHPYRIDISEVVKPGWNELQIQVTNLWPNRLIGDEQLQDPYHFTFAGSSGFEHLLGSGFEKIIGRPIEKLPEWYLRGEAKPDDGRIAFTTWKHYAKDDPLLESGLTGPVTIQSAVVKLI